MLIELERWSKENLGIVWVENVGFLAKLRERGNVCFAAGENEIEAEDGTRSIFASYAHATGRNIQRWNRMCFSNPFPNGKSTEQALAREHRPDCTYWDPKTKKHEIADDVFADVYLGCRETWWSFDRSRADARYIEATMGQPQRLNKATVVATDDETVGARCDAGDPLWAETGHALIDGKRGVVVDGVRQESHTPVLTALRKAAKEEAKKERAKARAEKKNAGKIVNEEVDDEDEDEDEDDEVFDELEDADD